MVSLEVLIKAHRLTKFGNFTAVDHIDFEVYKGECHACLLCAEHKLDEEEANQITQVKGEVNG